MLKNQIIKVITLHPDREDVKSLIDDLLSQGLVATPFIAVDGRTTIPSLFSEEKIDQEKSKNDRFVYLTNTEIGCYLSHLRAIREAFEKNVSHICLLEDDVGVEPDFATIVNALFALPEHYEFVRLMGLKRHRRKVVKVITEHRIVRPVKGLCGTQGYVLNRSGMKKVLECGSVITKPIDKFYDHFWEIDLKAYCIEPHIVWEKTTTSSVKKQSRKQATQSNKSGVQQKLKKLLRSIRRYIYITQHLHAFYPNALPPKKLGRTARIR